MQVTKYRSSRFFAVYDAQGELIVVTVYKRGAQEVLRRLTQEPPSQTAPQIGSIREASREASARAGVLRTPSSHTSVRKKKAKTK